jgi:exosortase C (VPDSG-CTERM-specific)
MPARPSRLRAFALFALAVGVVFAVPLLRVARFAINAEYYSHILLIPFISWYLIAQKRPALKNDLRTSVGPALAAGIAAVIGVIVAFVAPFGSHPADHHAAVIFTFLAVMLSGAFIFLGVNFLRPLMFPIGFLVFAIPLPYAVINQVQIWLQHASAEAAYWMLSLTGVPMLREGVDFRLPGNFIRVAEECSGFNSSFVLFIVSLLAGHLFLKSPKRKLALALAVIPLAILRNGFRVTVICLLCVHISPDMINSPIHRRGGPLFFALSLIPFLAMIWLLRRSENKTPDKE